MWLSWSPLMKRCSAWTALLLLFATAPASGQTSDAAAESRRRYFQEGDAAYRAGRVEEARVAFEQAYRLKPTPSLAYNLGLAELETGHFVDAARHIALYVHEAPRVTSQERKALAEAERHVGQLTLDVNVEGTALYVDDEAIGQSPLAHQPVYVQPGRHTIRASKEGFTDAIVASVVEVGHPTQLNLVMVLAQKPPAQASTIPPPANSTPPIADRPIPSNPVIVSEHRTWILAGGGALTAVALGTWAVEAARVSSLSNDISSMKASLQGSVCVQANAGCAALDEAVRDKDTAGKIGNIALASAALVGVATGVLYFALPAHKMISIAPGVHGGSGATVQVAW